MGRTAHRALMCPNGSERKKMEREEAGLRL